MARVSKLPIVPLLRDAVLLPGVTLRIPLQNRSDIPILLTSLFSRANPRLTTPDVILGCVPEASPLLSIDGQQLLDDAAAANSGQSDLLDLEREEDGSSILPEKEDLFRYGTVARVIGVQGRPNSEPYLLVEGTKRFVVRKVIRDSPYFEAEVVFHEDHPVATSDPNIPGLFDQLKMLSRELLTLLRLTSLLTSTNGPIPPSLVRRFEIFIAKKSVNQAGQLADFMADVVEASYEEKLQVLASLNLQDRLERVIELLSRQVTGFKNNIKVTSVTTTNFPPGVPIDMNNPLDPRQRPPNSSQRRPSLNEFRGLPAPPGFPGFGGPRDLDDDKEPNDIDELQHKLHDAQLTPEAQKVADREMRRLKKMNPANAEYGVTRTYLENIAEIPWLRVTEDQIGPETLNRARKQLDDDHYGLEGIKKRLLEYLAVLKLKHSINEDVDAQISKLSHDIKSGEHLDHSARPTDDDNSSSSSSNSVTHYNHHNTHHHHHHNERDAAETKLHILKSKRMVDKSPILLLVGPPGTGKTSLAKSIATSLGRKFHRISLGGVRDEAEIRGHRRTYVAAMPGLIVNGLKKAGVSNPVFLLDEIDKVGSANFHGDPSAAMLEVLDPEQNHTFSDHYVGIPIDLSKVLFIATANSLETIPPPLLDRMETVHFSGYTAVEKRHIARNHLLTKQLLTNGLADGLVRLSDDVLDKIINSYTREAGVRNLERQIGAVARYKAVQFADAKDAGNMDNYDPNVTLADLEEILGVEIFDEEIAEQFNRPGIVTGLVAFSIGGTGGILFIEVADMPGNGRVQLTGKLGDVLKESVEVALTWVKAHAFELGLSRDRNEDIMQRRSLHVHCPGGAIPKDGPSAGLAHTIALISLFSNKAVPPHIAMTGEISLRGRVLPVGGIKEKLIGAHRAGVKTVILPDQNRKDVVDVPEEVKNDLEIIHVVHIWDAVKQVWPHGHWPQEHWSVYESRL